MSDERLRDLERRWRATESVEAEAAYLLERVRVGDLDQARLDLAAYLGHRAAALVARPNTAPTAHRTEFCQRWAELDVPREDAEFVYLVNSLGHWDDECCARAAFAVARHVLSQRWPSEVSSAPSDTLAALGEWILCPCPAHAEASASAVRLANDSVPAWTEQGARLSVWVVGDAALVPGMTEPPGLFGPKAMAALRTARRALQVSDRKSLRAAVEEDLVPWALGESDPVVAFLQAREAGG